jgi:flagellar biosynthesis chaperone FliJ
MPKRGIDTPAKDDPNRKKPRPSSPEDSVGAEQSSESTPSAANLNVSVDSKAPAVFATGCSKTSKAAPATSATVKPKHAPATSGIAKSRGGSLLDVFRSGKSHEKAPAVTDKNKKAQPTKPAATDKKEKSTAASAEKSEAKAVIKKESDSKHIADLHNKRSVWGLGLVAALGVLNVASVSYLLSEQSRHSTAQLRCRVEKEKLTEDLSRNQGIISVLKSGLDAAENQIKFIEQAQESKRKALKARQEQRKSVGALTEEEKNQWAAKKESLRSKRDQLLDDFNIWLGKLDEVDGME